MSAITQITPQREIEATIQKQLQNRINSILYRFAYIGEHAVNLAKTNRGYTDQTGNLVSSIGYVLVKDGKIVSMPDFKKIKNGAEGVQLGQEFAAKKATEMIPKGIGLVLVAGMNYAEHVQATGRNVLALSEIEAKTMAVEMFNQLGLKTK